MKPLCEVIHTVQNPWCWFLIVEVFLVILAIFLIRHFIKILLRLKERGILWSVVIMPILLFFVLSVINFIIFFFVFFHDDYPPSADYHVLNAAIKNTCLLDPQKNHCPKTVQDIISIEPKHFTELTKDAHLTYQYYPETNLYTLIVRNNDLWRNSNRVVIFDPRLTEVETYGTGVDFVDTEVTSCEGRYTLINPPPFPGPWNEIN